MLCAEWSRRLTTGVTTAFSDLVVTWSLTGISVSCWEKPVGSGRGGAGGRAGWEDSGATWMAGGRGATGGLGLL